MLQIKSHGFDFLGSIPELALVEVGFESGADDIYVDEVINTLSGVEFAEPDIELEINRAPSVEVTKEQHELKGWHLIVTGIKPTWKLLKENG